MTVNAKSFRVVVVGVARGQKLTREALIQAVSDRYPLKADARLALSAGRSAVVQVSPTEATARRAATLLIKLGAEIRIEPDDPGDALADFGNIALEPGGDDDADGPTLVRAPPPGAATTEDGPTLVRPAPGDNPSIVDRLPTDYLSESAVVTLPTLGVGAPQSMEDSTMATLPRLDSAAQKAVEAVAREAAKEAPGGAAADGDHADDADETTEQRPQLIRCPQHGLLYDATTRPGCTRCLGNDQKEPFHLFPELRKKPRLWLAAGVLLGLLLGAIPAGLYARSVKNGPLISQRMEAETIRRVRAYGDETEPRYEKARAKVDSLRLRGVAFSALIWIGAAALLMLLWHRFV